MLNCRKEGNMKKSLRSFLLIFVILSSLILNSCDFMFTNFSDGDKEYQKIEISCTKPRAGMLVSDVGFAVTVNSIKTECTCSWEINTDNGFDCVDESEPFKALFEYCATLEYSIPDEGFDAENVSLDLASGGELSDSYYDIASGKVKSRIVFDVKRYIEFDGTYPASGEKVSDMAYTVKVDGEVTKTSLSWNDNSGSIRYMKQEDVFCEDIVYSLDLTYYVPVGTPYESIEFGGAMGGGEYIGSGYIDETGELWSHIIFDPEKTPVTYEITVDIDSPRTGQQPSSVTCTVKVNGEEVPCTVIWSSLNAETLGNIFDRGVFAEETNIAATVRFNIGKITSLEDVIIITGDNCREVDREYIPADSVNDEGFLSVILSFDKVDGESDEIDDAESETNNDDVQKNADDNDKVASGKICYHRYKLMSSANPTCTESGVKNYECTLCGISYTEKLSAVGHEYGVEYLSAPSCTEEGAEKLICKKCGDTKTETVSKLSHDFVDEKKAPSCTDSGYTKHICKNCGYGYSDNTVSPKGHSYIDTIISEKSCTTDGVVSHTCSVCGTCYTSADRTEGHIVLSWTPNYTSMEHCGTCTVCNSIIREAHSCTYSYIDEKQHRAVCSVCGVSYRENHNGSSCLICGG